MPVRRVLIGDIHGHFQGLKSLLTLLDLGGSDQVYFLGDLIDRGPDSSQVVELVRENQFTCLLGNHEQMMMSAFAKGREPDPFALQAWLCCGGRETLDSYPQIDQFYEHLDWMRQLPAYLDLGDVWLVHAGVDPTRSLSEQSSQEFCWIRSNFHTCQQAYFPDKLIVTGHTITFTFSGVSPGQIAQGQGWLDIDTGAYHPKSGWMTAIDLTAQLAYQINIFTSETQIRPLEDAITPIALKV